MSRLATPRIFALAASALMTAALFSGTGALAGHEARAVAMAQARQAATEQVALQVQHVTIIGHRVHA